MCTEWLDDREYDFAVATADGISLNVVKSTVDIGFLVGIQSVQVHHLQQWLAVDVSVGDVS